MEAFTQHCAALHCSTQVCATLRDKLLDQYEEFVMGGDITAQEKYEKEEGLEKGTAHEIATDELNQEMFYCNLRIIKENIQTDPVKAYFVLDEAHSVRLQVVSDVQDYVLSQLDHETKRTLIWYKEMTESMQESFDEMAEADTPCMKKDEGPLRKLRPETNHDEFLELMTDNPGAWADSMPDVTVNFVAEFAEPGKPRGIRGVIGVASADEDASLKAVDVNIMKKQGSITRSESAAAEAAATEAAAASFDADLLAHIGSATPKKRATDSQVKSKGKKKRKRGKK